MPVPAQSMTLMTEKKSLTRSFLSETPSQEAAGSILVF